MTLRMKIHTMRRRRAAPWGGKSLVDQMRDTRGEEESENVLPVSERRSIPRSQFPFKPKTILVIFITLSFKELKEDSPIDQESLCYSIFFLHKMMKCI